MIGGLDDRDDPHSLVALEAMVGLARLLELVKRQDLRSVLLHVAIRIRPFFDSVGRAGCRGSDRPVGLPPPPTPARRPGACSPGPRGPWHPHLHPTPRAQGWSQPGAAPHASLSRSVPRRPCHRDKEGGPGRGPKAQCWLTPALPPRPAPPHPTPPHPTPPGEDGAPLCVHPPLRAPQPGVPRGL